MKSAIKCFLALTGPNRTTVEPIVSNHPKCKDWVVAYGRWSFTRIEPRGASSEKRSRHIYFMEDNLLHACCYKSSSYILSKKANIARDQRMRQVVAYKSLEKMENH